MALHRSGKTASLYRMVMPDHLCPCGLSSGRINLGAGVDSHVNELQGTGPSTIPLPRTGSTET